MTLVRFAVAAATLLTLTLGEDAVPSIARGSAAASSTSQGSSQTDSPPTRFSPHRGRPYAGRSAWNLPVPSRPVLDPRSAYWADKLSANNAHQSALLHETGVPIYDADASTPRHTVRCRKKWGPCPLDAVPVPIPPTARPATGSDGALVIVDWSRGRSYEFWQARRDSSGRWSAAWGSVNSITGDGFDPRGHSPTGAGVPRLAGVVRTYEIRQGKIDHALVFATDISAPRGHRYPAAKTDGTNSRGIAHPLPEGARIQLDPSVNIAAIRGITPAEKTVAAALQKYGAYNIDNGGYHSMGFSFETPVAGHNPYPAAGFGWDYAAMPHIPWNKLRVLRQWNGR